MERFSFNDGADSTLASLAKKPAFRLEKAVPWSVFFQEKNVWFAAVTFYRLNGKLGKLVATRTFSPHAQKGMKLSAV